MKTKQFIINIKKINIESKNNQKYETLFNIDRYPYIIYFIEHKQKIYKKKFSVILEKNETNLLDVLEQSIEYFTTKLQ